MEFTFEQSILKETACKVVTADCTVAGAILSERHSFLPNCLGPAAAANNDALFLTYEGLISRIQVEAVPILKIDIETFEFPVFAEWREHSNALPEQIAVEVHWGEGKPPFQGPASQPQWGRGALSVSDLSLFFFHLANLGYGIVNQERNPDCNECSEFLLIRVEAVPRIGRGMRRFAP